MREDMLASILRDLGNVSPAIEAIAAVSLDGVVLATHGSRSAQSEAQGAITAALCALAERTAQEHARGPIEQILVKGKQGYLLISPAGPNVILALSVKRDGNLDLVYAGIGRALQALAKL